MLELANMDVNFYNCIVKLRKEMKKHVFKNTKINS